MFKVGDEVKVVGNNAKHGLIGGNVYSITRVQDYTPRGDTYYPVIFGIVDRSVAFRGPTTRWAFAEDLELALDSMNTYKQSGDNSGKMKAIMKGFAAKEKVVEDVEPKRKKIHVDSRNPQRYNFKITTVHGKSFCGDYCEYVLHTDYEKLKNKLCKMERKYAKLQRRHNRVGL